MSKIIYFVCVHSLNLNKKQLDRLSEFLANLSLIFLASVIAPIFTGNMLKLYITVFGVLIALGFLFLSLRLYKV